MFAITVFQTDNRDLAYFTTARTAPETEDAVTALHQRFPAPTFEVVVENC